MDNRFNLFSGADHQPFTFAGGENAALLVHGFPGTPVEMHALGETISSAGWTAQGLLLPGFGAQFPTLVERKMEEWVAAIDVAVDELERSHQRIVLVGFSMGAGLSLQVASRRPLAGLVLLAPFSKASGWFWTIFPIFKLVFPTIKPFRIFKVDFSRPDARAGMENLIPGMDLDDPEVQTAVRDFKFPVRVLGELRQVGRQAEQAASRVQCPTLVIQGDHDPVVRPATSRGLLQKLPGPLCYRQVPAAHDLTNPDRPAWPVIQEAVLEFLRSVPSGE